VTQPQGANTYLKTRVMTASPEELHLMLYDGAIKFCSQARDAINQKQIERSYHLLTRAQSIMLELMGGLKHDLAPELCGKQASLYNFIYRRLVEANLKKDAVAIDDALRILHYCRETWVLVMERLAHDRGVKAPDAAETRDETEGQKQPASIDLQG
jgi:flagellar protein FliS